MKISKAQKRDRKISRRRNGMRRDGDSLKDIQRLTIKRRDVIINKRRKQKEDTLKDTV